jgi:hypothetical protein
MRDGQRHVDSALELRAGESVEVRSKDEILATLTSNGRLDALPFMPEMLRYCGKRFRVYKRAHKTCDTIVRPAGLRMESAVHLEGVRCDGAAHGGCQAGCLIFWKEAWLKRIAVAPAADSVEKTIPSLPDTEPSEAQNNNVACTEDVLFTETRARSVESSEEIYSCQATELRRATSDLPWWDIRQYIQDLTSRNVSLAALIRVMSVAIFNVVMRQTRYLVLAISQRAALRLPGDVLKRGDCDTINEAPANQPAPQTGTVATIKAALNRVLVEYPHIRGRLRTTPSSVLNLRPGETVQVKTKEEILDTLDAGNRNRGLLFDAEMVPYCGRRFKVLRRVDRILNEKTGRMRVLPNVCIVLEDVFCKGCLSRNRLFCPRSIYSYWHEIWLKRAE